MRFTRQSQSCTAGSRLFLHRDIFDIFLDALGHTVKALKLGDPLDEASDIGTIINEKQFNKVCGRSTRGLVRVLVTLTEATRKAVSAASFPSKACWRATRRGRTSRST